MDAELREDVLDVMPHRVRAHVELIGEHAVVYITEIVHRRPRVWIRDVDRLHDLLERHGDLAVRAAIARGLDEGAFGAEYIAHYLIATDDAFRGVAQQELLV